MHKLKKLNSIKGFIIKKKNNTKSIAPCANSPPSRSGTKEPLKNVSAVVFPNWSLYFQIIWVCHFVLIYFICCDQVNNSAQTCYYYVPDTVAGNEQNRQDYYIRET